MKGANSTTMAGRRISMLLVDDHPMLREGLADFLSNEPGLEVVGQASGAAVAMRQVRELRPNFVVVDISLENGNGIELVKEIRCFSGNIKILVFSMHDESLYAERAIRAGAMGYLSKQDSRAKLLEAIRAISEGRMYLSEEMTDRMIARSLGRSDAAVGSPVDMLSDRELQVFELIGRGKTVRQIAETLHLSPKTVETHREHIKTKLNAENATDLVRRAVEWFLNETT